MATAVHAPHLPRPPFTEPTAAEDRSHSARRSRDSHSYGMDRRRQRKHARAARHGRWPYPLRRRTPLGARITLERDGHIAPFAITCGISGWLLHTRFFGSQQDAEQDYLLMRAALDVILHRALAGEDENTDESMAQMADAIAAFVEQYP